MNGLRLSVEFIDQCNVAVLVDSELVKTVGLLLNVITEKQKQTIM